MRPRHRLCRLRPAFWRRWNVLQRLHVRWRRQLQRRRPGRRVCLVRLWPRLRRLRRARACPGSAPRIAAVQCHVLECLLLRERQRVRRRRSGRHVQLVRTCHRLHGLRPSARALRLPRRAADQRACQQSASLVLVARPLWPLRPRYLRLCHRAPVPRHVPSRMPRAGQPTDAQPARAAAELQPSTAAESAGATAAAATALA